MDVYTLDFPGSSPGKESICNAGDLWLIPGSGKSPGEEIGYPLQYTWASLMAQLVKSLPAVWETWVQSLAWEDPLEENTATHSDTCARRIPMDRGAWWATVHGVTELDTIELLSSSSSTRLIGKSSCPSLYLCQAFLGLYVSRVLYPALPSHSWHCVRRFVRSSKQAWPSEVPPSGDACCCWC